MSNYVIHTGVLGMHWGDRNGPPYPLAKEVRSAMKAGKKAAIQKTTQKVVNETTNKMVGKKDKIDINKKKLLNEALITMGTVAVTSLITKGLDSGTDKMLKVGTMAVNKAKDKIGEQILKRQFAKVGAIYI